MGEFQAKFEEHMLHTRFAKLLRQTGKKHEKRLRLTKNEMAGISAPTMRLR